MASAPATVSPPVTWAQVSSAENSISATRRASSATTSDFGSNNVLTAMGNVIIGIPIGGTKGAGVRPYVTGGLGLIRTSYGDLLNFDAVSNNDFGYNLGAGVMGYLRHPRRHPR